MTGRPLFGRPETALPKPLTEQEVWERAEKAERERDEYQAWYELRDAELVRLQQRLAEAERERDELERVNERVVEACTDATTAADVARAALEFYAQQYGLGARLASDGGQKARDALAAMKRQR